MYTLPVTCNQIICAVMVASFIIMLWGANEVWYVQYKMLDGNWLYTISALLGGAMFSCILLAKTAIWLDDNIKCRCDK
jgi:hypothetical protein